MQWHCDGYTIDTDRDRLDQARIAAWLRKSYWASTRPPAAVRRSWQEAGVVFGLYHGQEMVGCARVVTDFVSIAYLADVYLMPEHRGRGLGRWLVQSIVAHPELATVGWLLHTRDAHGLYRQAGFADPSSRLMERPRPKPPTTEVPKA